MINKEQKNRIVSNIDRNKSHSVKNIAVIGNAPETLIRFRLDFIKELINLNHTVYAFSTQYTTEQKSILKDAGAIPVTYHLDRIGTNPIADFKLIKVYKQLLVEHKIEVVFSYFLKPVIFASIAAHKVGIKEIYSMLGGLGYVFTHSENGLPYFKRKFLRFVVEMLLKYALRFNKKVFFQNPDDLNLLTDNGILKKEKTFRIYGSGVSLELFPFTQEVIDPVTFIISGRLIKDKGYLEFVEAAKILKKKYNNIKFIILGGSDDNPNALPEDVLENWKTEGLIEWPGLVDDVQVWIRKSSVFVLPSYYREGTPRSILEAMAMGKPIVTTDHPGCRETVVEGLNGFLVPVQNSDKLAEAMEKFIQTPDLIKEMGMESRKLAEKYYDVNKVNQVLISEMKLG